MSDRGECLTDSGLGEIPDAAAQLGMTASSAAQVAGGGGKQPRVHIETWGCQMNVADSEHMFAMLKEQRYVHTDLPDEADLVILNTCHIREKAFHKVMSRLGVLKQIKQKRPGMKIVVSGCVAQAEGKRLLDQSSAIDVLLGPGKIDQLPELLRKHDNTNTHQEALGFLKKNETPLPPPVLEEPFLANRATVSRFVNIQQGCNNFCTFCVVPFTRGPEVSHAPDVVLDKVKALVDLGAVEVTLLGQNVNSYGSDLVAKGELARTPTGPFVDLLRGVVQVPGVRRVRFTTSNPHDLTLPLARLFGEFPQLGSYFHLPVQSGSDPVLAAMRRKVTVAEYLERIGWLRAAVPDMTLSTDLIVGFPGETDEDFLATIELVKKVRFSFAFSFAYSKRKGTAAQRFRDQVPEDVKVKRLAHLNAVQDAITLELNTAEIGHEREVLFHYESKKEPGIYYGRTEHFRLIRVQAGRNLVGQILPVRVIGANKTALVGSCAAHA